jgi:hypothetical protein
LTLPKDFKPKTLEQMVNPEKVYFSNKRGRLSTFPLSYISICQKQERIQKQKNLVRSKAISKKKTAKKRRRKRVNPFEGPKGVRIPKLNIDWTSKTASTNFMETIESLQKSKQLNSDGSMAFMKVFMMHRYSRVIQKSL